MGRRKPYRGRFLEELPLFCEFYPGLTPEAFWSLKWPEYRALKDHIIKRSKESNG